MARVLPLSIEAGEMARGGETVTSIRSSSAEASCKGIEHSEQNTKDDEYARLVTPAQHATADINTVVLSEQPKSRSFNWWMKVLLRCFLLILVSYVFVKWGVPFAFEKMAAAPWDYYSHGEDAGDFASLLRQLMQCLEYRQPPIFRGRKTRILDRDLWSMEVFLYAREGEFNSQKYPIKHPRSRCFDAVQDAARLAIDELCHLHKDAVDQSPFCFFINPRAGQRYPDPFDIPVDDPRLSHQVQLTQAMAVTYARAQEEIGQLRMLLTSSYQHSDTLRAQLLRDQTDEFGLKRLKAVPDYTPSLPVPAAVPNNRAPLRPAGLRTRLTARKKVHRPSPPPVIILTKRKPSPSRSRSTASSRNRPRASTDCDCSRHHVSKHEEPEEEPEEPEEEEHEEDPEERIFGED